GEVIERGTPAELKRRVGGEQIVVVTANPSDAPRVVDGLASFACGDAHVEDSGRRVLVPVHEVRGIVPAAVRRLDELAIEVDDVGVRHSSLDDVFFALTGRAIAPDDESETDDEDEEPVAERPRILP